MRPDLLHQYLGLLAIQRREPGFDALCELVRAHLIRVPFENLSKLYYLKHLGLRGLPGLELFLDGIRRFNFGGTCYANNYYLHQLLVDLGYQVALCGADMSQPCVHMVNLVTVEGQEYLVDVGYAAPFLTPLPRNLKTDHVLALGRDRYVLEPQDAQGCSRMELYRDGNLTHGYVVQPAPRQIQDFEPAIAASFRGEATFMKALLLARFFPDRSRVLHNFDLIESHGTVSSLRRLASRDELIETVQEGFGIPREVTSFVLNGLGDLEDVWS